MTDTLAREGALGDGLRPSPPAIVLDGNDRRALRSLLCEQGVPCLVNRGAIEAGGRMLAVATGNEGADFVAVVAAMAVDLGLTIEVVGLIDDSVDWPDDLSESAAARGLSTAFASLLDQAPDWDVVHGREALEAYVRSRRTDV